MDLENRSHIGTSPFQYLNWLPVEKIGHQVNLSHILKLSQELLLIFCRNLSVPVSSEHNHSKWLIVTTCASAYSTFSFTLRDSGCFSLPKVKGFGKKYFASIGSN